MKRLNCILLLLLVLLLLAGCGGKEGETIVCSLEIRCDVLIGCETLDPDKSGLVPEDGVILCVEKAEITSGSSVEDLLKQELQAAMIPYEFSVNPLYNTSYIEGISNLYEQDAGDLSGWVYTVNGETTQLGCSDYILEPGDSVLWEYTLTLGTAAEMGE